jgi:hypothetical protein
MEGLYFPTGSVLWDLNYRGDLTFLRNGRSQESIRQLTLLDGWHYFLHNWYVCLTRIAGMDPTQDRFVAFMEATPAWDR